MSTTHELRELMEGNVSHLPQVLVRKMYSAIDVVDSNLNEQRVIIPLRQLILSTTLNILNILNIDQVSNIVAYLESPDTQISATRKLFELFLDQDPQLI